MWIIKHIFDGDYGCEEAEPRSKPRVSITLENESGEQRYETIEDAWLTENGLDVGSIWPEASDAVWQ
jgi:hypothetical protein